MGIKPTHLNSEKHLHLWPSAFRVVAKLAEEFEVPCVRVVREPFSFRPIPQALTELATVDSRTASSHGLAMPDATIGVTEAPTTLAALKRLLDSSPGRNVEFVVHPGYVDEEFREIGRTLPNRLECSREEELAVLTSPEARSSWPALASISCPRRSVARDAVRTRSAGRGSVPRVERTQIRPVRRA